MSGGSIAYHLRPNKNVERKLFIDLLRRVGRHVNISDYTYIGFAGPFAEDFKEIHAALRIQKMISIEMDENVPNRQKFNYPARFIEYFHGTSGEYIKNSDEVETPTIVWLDYTKASKLNTQINEFRDLISKLNSLDIVKITLNAHTSAIAQNTPPKQNPNEFRAKKFKERVDDLWEDEITVDDILEENLPKTLLKKIKKSLSGLSKTGFYFQPLSAYSYQDGMQMFTLTGIILEARNAINKQNFFTRSRLEHWPFSNLDWSDPINISVPDLSAKERMAIDAELPLDQGTLPNIPPGIHLHRALGFAPCESDQLEKGISLLDNYARFYRSYPMFSKTEI